MTQTSLFDRSLRDLTRQGRAMIAACDEAMTAGLYRLPLIGPRLLLARLASGDPR